MDSNQQTCSFESRIAEELSLKDATSSEISHEPYHIGQELISSPYRYEKSSPGKDCLEGDQAVADCLDLLRNSADIKAAVISLSNDPAMWEAFARNSKVQELITSNNNHEVTNPNEMARAFLDNQIL